MRRQTPEHDGLTLLVLPRFPSVVLVWVVAIRVVPIFWPVTVSSLPLSLLLVKRKHSWVCIYGFDLVSDSSRCVHRWGRHTSGLSLDPLRSSNRSFRRSSPQRRILSRSWSRSRLSRQSESSRDWSDPYLPLRSVRLILSKGGKKITSASDSFQRVYCSVAYAV